MIINTLQLFLGAELATFVMAMFPVLELRGALPFGIAVGLPVAEAFCLAVLGNMVPVPFIILFIRKIFSWMSDHSPELRSLVQGLEERAYKKAKVFYKYQLVGLILLVAIPLPGTGAWTGALVAAILKIRLKVAIPCILLGVLLAGAIVTLTILGVIHVSG